MLKDSIRINNLELRNRIVMPPMATGKANQGKPDEQKTLPRRAYHLQGERDEYLQMHLRRWMISLWIPSSLLM